MPNRLFIKVNDKRYGPFDMAKIHTLAATGKLLREHLLSEDGVSNWIRASEIVSLFPAAESTTATPTTSPLPKTGMVPREEAAAAELQLRGKGNDGVVSQQATKLPKRTLSNRAKMGLLAGMILLVLLTLSGMCWRLAATTSTTQTIVAIPHVKPAPIAPVVNQNDAEPVEDHTDEDPVEVELRKLKGSYRLLRGDIQGDTMPAAILKGARLRIDGRKHFRQFNSQFVHGTMVIDPLPDLKIWDSIDSDGLHAGIETKGIYKLEGDILTISTAPLGSERPTEFMTSGHPGQARFVWKRVE